MQLIGFRSHLRPEIVAGEAVYLFSEQGVTALTGAHIEALAPLLDRTRDLQTLLRDLPAGINADQAGELVAKLKAAGLLTSQSQPGGTVDDRALAYWDTCGLNPADAATAVADARLALTTVGGLDSAPFAGALREAGLQVHLEPGGGSEACTADLSIVLCTDYLDPRLGDIDAAHRATGRPWLLARPVGARVWIGPIFQPPGNACWHCLAVRLMGHRQPEQYVQRTLGRNGPVPHSGAALPPVTGLALQLVALEASKWLAGHNHPGQRGVWTFDSLDLRGQHHELRARPQCAACGDPDLVRASVSRPITLTSRPKHSGGTGHRSRPPQEVLAAYRHLVSPITGVIKEIRRDRRGPALFNSYLSGPTLYRGARSLEGLRSSMGVENGGKGVTAIDAEVSALCEAIERHSATFSGDEAVVEGSLREIGEPAIHPNDCMLYHERQYADRERWNAAHAPFQYVCAPFDEDERRDWTPVWSLTEGRHRMLPTGLLYFGAPAVPGPLRVRADSNGNAAGTSLEDAILQGLFELIERDAVALWWYNRNCAPAVDLDAFADPWIDRLRQVYRTLGREVWVLDVTSDLRVPTMVALSRRLGGGPEQIVFGFGAHLDPAVALRRALTELNQLMPAVLDTARGCGAAQDPDASRWLTSATVRNQPYVVPDPAAEPIRPADYGYRPGHDLLDDLRVVQQRLERRGMQLLVLDQTRPDIGLPAVKVIVPGMRHFWARFGPGRLYDLPVELGRLDRPTTYDELNPIALFV